MPGIDIDWLEQQSQQDGKSCVRKTQKSLKKGTCAIGKIPIRIEVLLSLSYFGRNVCSSELL